MKTIKSKRFGHWEQRMNGFEQHGLKPKAFIKMLMQYGLARADAKRHMRELQQAEVWYSAYGKSKVVKQGVTKEWGLVHADGLEGLTWLSIRIDNGATHLCDWKDFQAIKNDLTSPTREGIEVYPSVDRLHDTDNVFHMWVFPEGYMLPIGWANKDVDYTKDNSPYQRAENE